MNAPLQFGERNPDLTYKDRRAAFGVAVRDGKVACAHITRGEDRYFDLPGGALDPGESEETALAREFREETGLTVQVDGLLARANQYVIRADGSAVNNRGAVYRVTVVGYDPAHKVDDDHELVWLDPLEALAAMRHGAHAFALATWLKAEQDGAAVAEDRGLQASRRNGLQAEPLSP